MPTCRKSPSLLQTEEIRTPPHLQFYGAKAKRESNHCDREDGHGCDGEGFQRIGLSFTLLRVLVEGHGSTRVDRNEHWRYKKRNHERGKLQRKRPHEAVMPNEDAVVPVHTEEDASKESRESRPQNPRLHDTPERGLRRFRERCPHPVSFCYPKVEHHPLKIV